MTGSSHVVGEGRRGYAVVAGQRPARPQGGRGRDRAGASPASGAWKAGDTMSQSDAPVVVTHTSVSPSRPTTSSSRSPSGRRASTFKARASAAAPLRCACGRTSRCCGATSPQGRGAAPPRRGPPPFGVGSLQFITRAGVRILISQHAGIVISLLVAFSLVALVAAGTMLAAGARPRSRAACRLRRSARARLRPGRWRAARRWRLRCRRPRRGARPASARSCRRPAARPARLLNELRPGAAPLPAALGLLAIVVLVVGAATWPAWRAARRPPAESSAAATSRGGRLAEGRRPCRARRAPRHGRSWPLVRRGRASPSARAWSR